MTERPIIFSGQMVRAILDGRKTQTRRPIKPQPKDVGYGRHCEVAPYCTGTKWPLAYYERRGACWNSSAPLRCPYRQPGDRLWVRETFAYCHWVGFHLPVQRDDKEPGTVAYRADGDNEGFGLSWRPAIHMPRWASRLTLEVASVRPERVQDISEEDAIAEGLIAQVGDGSGPRAGYKWTGIGYHGAGFTSRRGWRNEPTFHVPDATGKCRCRVGGPTPAQCAFRELWDSINAKRDYGWASNPWVWAVTFRLLPSDKVQGNE